MSERRKTIGFGLAGALIGLAVVVFCWSNISRHVSSSRLWMTPAEAFSLADRLDIMELTARHAFSSSGAPGKEWFLAVGDSDDPSPDLLQRLRDVQPPVKPLSMAIEKGAALVDVATGQEGIALYFKRAQMRTADKVELDALVRPSAATGGSNRVYVARRSDGKWNVSDETSK